MCTHVIGSVFVCLNHYIRGPIIIPQEKLSGTERVLLIYRVVYSQLTHFRTHFCWVIRCRGAESAHWGRNYVLPFQNLFRENGSVEYVMWSWIMKSIIMYQVSCGLYGHRTSRSWFVPTWKTVCTGATHTQYRSWSMLCGMKVRQ